MGGVFFFVDMHAMQSSGCSAAHISSDFASVDVHVVSNSLRSTATIHVGGKPTYVIYTRNVLQFRSFQLHMLLQWEMVAFSLSVEI